MKTIYKTAENDIFQLTQKGVISIANYNGFFIVEDDNCFYNLDENNRHEKVIFIHKDDFKYCDFEQFYMFFELGLVTLL